VTVSEQVVTVFGASGRQGQAQVRQLLATGRGVRAVSRNPEIFTQPGLCAAEVISADYADPGSLRRACEGADAVFFQPPQAVRPDLLPGYVQSVGQAALDAGVSRFLHNSTMWAPDEPCGQAMYDGVLAIENLLAELQLPLTVFRPTVYMDNWLTEFARPAIVEQHVYRYPHRPGLRYTPISLDDVAKFMVASLEKPDLVGQRVRVSGPETLTPVDVAGILSDTLGTEIRHEWIDPAAFGRQIYPLVGAATGLDEDSYAAFFADFYTFNNQAPQEPFRFDVAPVLEQLPIPLESFAAWAARQSWDGTQKTIGSTSG
jgi:uncharacterized protein YbjT (DUF2867 family)